MNKNTIHGTLLLLVSLITFSGAAARAADSTISSDQLEQRRERLFYEIGSDTPYTGLIVKHYENGQQRSAITVVFGRPTGGTQWFESGQKKAEANMDESETGHMTEWYENGQMKSDQNMLNGRPDGLVTMWYDNGQMKSREMLVDRRSESKSSWDVDGTDTTVPVTIEEALNMARGAKAAVAEFYMDQGKMPVDNATAGLAEGSNITGFSVTSIFVNSGVITIMLGNRADASYTGHTLILTPDFSLGNIDWECSSPDLDAALLPAICR